MISLREIVVMVVLGIVLVAFIALSPLIQEIASGAACVSKDPQVAVPGWADHELEFENGYDTLVICNDIGHCWINKNTKPGWIGTPDRTLIDFVVMCR